MKNKIIYTLLLPLSTALSTAAMAELSKEDLAQEVAHCYVGHQRAASDDYKSGKAEQLKVVIGDLVGGGDVNKMIQIADRIQRQRSTGTPGAYAPTKSGKKVMKKYCPSLDAKLAKVSS